MLEAAHRCGRQARAGCDQRRPAGRRRGVDSGASPGGSRLVDALDLGSRRVHPTEARPTLVLGGQHTRLPASLLGVPTDVADLADLLSAEGWRTAASEPERPAPAFDDDVTIGRYVDERFGAEVTDRLLEPLLGGVYAGHARRLSFDAVAPSAVRACPGRWLACSSTPGR